VASGVGGSDDESLKQDASGCPEEGVCAVGGLVGPLICRWYESVSVYGTTITKLIHEEFGDGIMRAINFSMDIARTPDPKGERVNVVLSGRFLPYKTC
jgi:cyanase